MNRRPKVIIITGPTSSGKSDVAIFLAKQFDGEVVSADSRQIYRDMDLGTGKVTCDFSVPKSKCDPKEALLGCRTQNTKLQLRSKKFIPYYSKDIPHYMINIASPKMKYNISKFKKDAEKVIENILLRGKIPIICGGTGFWIKAIVDNVSFPEVKPDQKLRNKLHNKSAKELFEQLKKLDPERAGAIDPKNKVRLVRAIEICKQLGKVPKASNGSRNVNYEFLQIGIDHSKEELEEKIKKRLRERFMDGMVDEVKMLKKKYHLSWKKIRSFGLAYFWIPLFLQNRIGRKELEERVFLAERNYAKRQRTWLKKEKRIIWLKNYGEIKKEVQKFLK